VAHAARPRDLLALLAGGAVPDADRDRQRRVLAHLPQAAPPLLALDAQGAATQGGQTHAPHQRAARRYCAHLLRQLATAQRLQRGGRPARPVPGPTEHGGGVRHVPHGRHVVRLLKPAPLRMAQ